MLSRAAKLAAGPTGAYAALKQALGDRVKDVRGSKRLTESAVCIVNDSMMDRTLEKLLGKDALRIISRGGVVEGALDAVAQQALRNAQEADPDTGL